ncbi:hypothetical protein [Aquimarina algicola]|uniref:Receptor L-domain domain-containing protein n=1 Tax=Aquimarina algicola TaxID=2589995 RepID=A0A504J399_9FLAO|nr:hypothetical protein [Aquimarina algicola]TPN85357.1 hypothetical protein FHK87_15175 [Aquimarina algicola]
MKKMCIRFFLITIVLSYFSCSPEDGNNGMDGTDGTDGTDVDGITTLIISGDITDEEVSQIITEDLGTNTREIIVANTVNLTSLDLSQISTVPKIEISNNIKLENLVLTNLESISEEIIIDNNDLLTTINLENLSTAKTLDIRDNKVLNSINLSRLGEVERVAVSRNETLENLSFPMLENVTSTFFVGNHNALVEIDAANLESVGSLSIQRNIRLASIDFPSLINTSNIRIADNDMIQRISFANLERVGVDTANSIAISEDLLEELNFSKLTSFSSMNIDSTVLLTSVTLSSIQDFDRLFLDSRPGKLSTAVIDQVLSDLVNATPAITGSEISLSGTASAQALTDAETLRTSGNTVTITD